MTNTATCYTLGTRNSRAVREHALPYPGKCLQDLYSTREYRSPTNCMDTTNEDVIIAAVERDSHGEVRATSRETGSTLTEYFGTISLHPCHDSPSAHLFPADRPLRIQFCRWLRHQHAANEPFLHNTTWTGEALFMQEGNVHNINLWTRFPRIWVSCLLHRHRLG